MDEQESYLNEDEISQSLNNVGNKVNQFGQGMYSGIKSGLNDYKDIKNYGLQSSNKSLDNDKKDSQIPQSKNQNTNPTGVINPKTESNNVNNSLPDKNNDLNDKEKNKSKDNKEKKSSLKDKIDEHNPLNKLKEKIDEHNPLKKLNKKIEDKLDPAKVVLKKIKLYGGLIILCGALILILIIALVGGTVMHTTLHNITEDFVCSMGEVTLEENTQVISTFGWYLKETGEYETIIIEKEEKQVPIYEAIFNTGIDLRLTEGTKIRSNQPGTITKINNDYIEINHNLNKENSYNNKEYITRYYNYGKIFEGIKENDLVVKETTLSFADKGIVHFEITEDGKYFDPNLMFGYEASGDICGDKDVIKITKGTIANEDIKKLLDNKCVSRTEEIGRNNGKQKACNNSYYGVPEGEYTSLICGSTGLNAKGPGKAQCAAGVYGYFNSFLPKLDQNAWIKFNAIRGNAVDYWLNNNKLGKNGFKADLNPTPGSVWVSSYSSSMCGGAPCGHVMAVISVNGENVNVFECNYDRRESCWYHNYTKSYLSNYRGFLGYIHILGEC